MPTCASGSPHAAALRKERLLGSFPPARGSGRVTSPRRHAQPRAERPRSTERRGNRNVIRRAAHQVELASADWAAKQIERITVDELRRELEHERTCAAQREGQLTQQLSRAHDELAQLKRKFAAVQACETCCLAVPVLTSKVLELQTELSAWQTQNTHVCGDRARDANASASTNQSQSGFGTDADAIDDVLLL